MKTFLKVVGGLVLLLVVAGAVGAFWVQRKSEQMLARTISLPTEAVEIKLDSVTLARGKHLAEAVLMCADCHGPDLAGRVLIDDPAMGRVETPNLTAGKGGLGGRITDANLTKTIRHSVGHDERQLLVMPSYIDLSLEDLTAIASYVRSRPPVDKEHPPFKLGPVARVLIATGVAPFFKSDSTNHSAAPMSPGAPAPTKEYGRYLTRVAGCADCHGPGFSGGKIADGDPKWPAAANISPTGLKAYDEAKFIQAIRTGVRPAGTTLHEAMPWRFYKDMTDVELKALWTYLQTVPPKEFGGH